MRLRLLKKLAADFQMKCEITSEGHLTLFDLPLRVAKFYFKDQTLKVVSRSELDVTAPVST
jgi:hypothetical protein